MTAAEITDLRRELEKARLALIAAQTHLTAHAEMNAALHCATTVMHSPLHARVTNAIAGIEQSLERTDHPRLPTLDHQSNDGPWAALLADLDRCQHGRHRNDACSSCPHGHSTGNPHVQTGQLLGYGQRGQIVVPDPLDRTDAAAWRREA